jgi:hypothetical protein
MLAYLKSQELVLAMWRKKFALMSKIFTTVTVDSLHTVENKLKLD